MYQESLKEEGKKIRDEFYRYQWLDLSYYDVDFFRGPNENFNYLTNDENVNIE